MINYIDCYKVFIQLNRIINLLLTKTIEQLKFFKLKFKAGSTLFGRGGQCRVEHR